MPSLRATTAKLRQQHLAAHRSLELHWTGFVAFNHDFRRTGSSDVADAEMRALPITVALNLLSVVAAIGVLVIIFQDGHGVRWFGLEGPTGGVFSSVPLLIFCVVFGLSWTTRFPRRARAGNQAQRPERT